MYKKNGRLQVCIDLRNEAGLIDGYSLLVADVLVDAAVGHNVIGFNFYGWKCWIESNFMAEGDIHKTALRCHGHVGLFECVVMTLLVPVVSIRKENSKLAP